MPALAALVEDSLPLVGASELHRIVLHRWLQRPTLSKWRLQYAQRTQSPSGGLTDLHLGHSSCTTAREGPSACAAAPPRAMACAARYSTSHAGTGRGVECVTVTRLPSSAWQRANSHMAADSEPGQRRLHAPSTRQPQEHLSHVTVSPTSGNTMSVPQCRQKGADGDQTSMLLLGSEQFSRRFKAATSSSRRGSSRSSPHDPRGTASDSNLPAAHASRA